MATCSSPVPATPPATIERKACYNSTGDADATTGMLTGGGQAGQGNSEPFGASNADWLARTTPEPQNLASPVEQKTCPQSHGGRLSGGRACVYVGNRFPLPRTPRRKR
jgi:hypothetical protein